MTYILITSFLLNIMPGPAMFYVTQQTLSRNSRAIIYSIMGIEFGTLLHVIASSAGLTYILAQWASFHSVANYVSAGFLIYLGTSQLIKPKKIKDATPQSSVFLKGALINALNPKIILFFMTILPQFMGAHVNYTTVHILWMGLLFGLFGGLINILLSFAVKTSLNSMQNTDKLFLILKWLTQMISFLFILLGIAFLWLH